MKPPPDPVWQRPDAILQRMVAELAKCQTMLHGVETVVGPLVAARVTSASSHALQDIDRLGQTLADLATCLGVLAANLDGSSEIDARQILQAMRLDDLAQRLAGRAVVPTPTDARVALF